MAVACPPGGSRRNAPHALRPVDLLLAGYLVVVSVVAVVRAPGASRLLVAPRRPRPLRSAAVSGHPPWARAGRPHAFARSTPCCSSSALYSELDVLNGPGGTAVHDATVQRLGAGDLRRRSSAPSGGGRCPSRFWSAVLHAAYFSYYLIVVGPGVLLRLAPRPRGRAPFRAGRDDDLRRLLSRVHLLPGGRALLRLSPSRSVVTRQPVRPRWCTTRWRPAARTERHSPARTWPRRSPRRCRPGAARGRSAWTLAVPTRAAHGRRGLLPDALRGGRDRGAAGRGRS